MEYVLSNHAAKRMQERKIEPRWLELTLTAPDLDEPDPIDPDVHLAFKRIVEMDDRVLRVVYNRVASPIRIVPVYFDRGTKGKL